MTKHASILGGREAYLGFYIGDYYISLAIGSTKLSLGRWKIEETSMVGDGNHMTKYSSLHYLVLSSSTLLSRTKKEINVCE
jgi:hypothetical protein